MKKNSINKTWGNYLNKVKLEHDGEVLREYLRVLGNFQSYLPFNHRYRTDIRP
jgi:hypothetical protein